MGRDPWPQHLLVRSPARHRRSQPRDTGQPRVYWETDGSVPDTSDAVNFKAEKNAAQDRVWVVIPWDRLTCPGTLRIRAVVTLRNYSL